MKKYVCLLILCHFIIYTSVAQIEIEPVKGNVSNSAYSKKISQDFNFLLLGDNSPQQGISATLNEKGSNIKINGLLYTGNKELISMEADLSASNGVYFFDQDKGSEQGKITLNYYRAIKRKSEFYRASDLVKTTVKLQILDLLSQAKSDYYELKKLVQENMESTFIKENSKDKAWIKLKNLSIKHINDQHNLGFDLFETREFSLKSYKLKKTEKVVLKNGKKLEDGKRGDLKIENVDTLNLGKIVKDYFKKREYILEELEEEINQIELENVESQWAGNHIWFVGISPFYKRESFKRFTNDSTKTFADMFSTEKGDIYGVTLALNYSLQKGIGSTSKLKPHNLLLRFLASASRASNISSFKTSTLNLNSPIGNDVNGNPINFSNTDAAFIGDSTYEYGNSVAFTFEAYYYPLKTPIGLFTRFGYEYINFSRLKQIKDKELSPMRLGLLFSLKNKEKNKPLLTIQTFLDRTDLSLDPKGKDNDLRFGIGIGLPINIKQ